MTARWPIVLPHGHVARISNSRPTKLILTRELRPDTYEIHDALTVQRNVRHSRQGRPDLQGTPFVFSIDIAGRATTPLLALELITVRDAGYKTLEDFYLEWLTRRRQIVIGLDVHIYDFQIVETTRFLHRRVHRGYTHNPALAANDERPSEALTDSELEQLATANRERYKRERADETGRREARSLANQLREAHARAALRGVDVTLEIQAIRQQLDQIRAKLGTAA